MIRPATRDDAARICAIYNPYIDATTITFEEMHVPISDMSVRIENIIQTLPWLVVEQDGVVVGYANAMPWRTRAAYRYSAETTIYMDSAATGKGFGTWLYRALLAELIHRGLHRVIGGIALPNAASIALHQRLGFKKVAQFSEVGWKFGQWIDVGFWELAL
ncbi:MAG: arsinothricin resistance N-acetyltransferase ArsN1 family B [Rhodanobacteraceae bacterium]